MADEREDDRARGKGDEPGDEAKRAAFEAGRDLEREEDLELRVVPPDAHQETEALAFRGVPDVADREQISDLLAEEIDLEAPAHTASEEALGELGDTRAPSPVEGEAPNLREGLPIEPRPAPEVISLDELDPGLVESIPEGSRPDPVSTRDLMPTDPVGGQRARAASNAGDEPMLSELVEPRSRDEGAPPDDGARSRPIEAEPSDARPTESGGDNPARSAGAARRSSISPAVGVPRADDDALPPTIVPTAKPGAPPAVPPRSERQESPHSAPAPAKDRDRPRPGKTSRKRKTG